MFTRIATQEPQRLLPGSVVLSVNGLRGYDSAAALRIHSAAALHTEGICPTGRWRI